MGSGKQEVKLDVLNWWGSHDAEAGPMCVCE